MECAQNTPRNHIPKDLPHEPIQLSEKPTANPVLETISRKIVV